MTVVCANEGSLYGNRYIRFRQEVHKGEWFSRTFLFLSNDDFGVTILDAREWRKPATTCLRQMDTETRVQLWLNAYHEQQHGGSMMENAGSIQRTQTAFDCKPPAADQQPIPNNAIHTSESVTNDDSPIEEELSENTNDHLCTHSILRPAQNLLIRYLRDQADIKATRSSPSLDVITELPSMLFSTLPLLISIWALTSYCWIPLCGLMIWERMGSDVIYEFLYRILQGLGWLREVIRGTYEIATVMNSSAAMSKGARRVLPWADEQMNDEGALESLLYPHCGSL